jgi:hypothetical protein
MARQIQRKSYISLSNRTFPGDSTNKLSRENIRRYSGNNL